MAQSGLGLGFGLVLGYKEASTLHKYARTTSLEQFRNNAEEKYRKRDREIRQEGENLEDSDRFLEESRMEQRKRINSLGSNVGDLVTVDEYVGDTEQTQTKTFKHQKSAQQQETETDSRYGRQAQIIRNRDENERTERELELRRRLLELENRESKHREREEHMYEYWKRK
ncbi:hypothetical protein DPMN_028405 [Dreissena polymorpha]|uniref:Uncharacterized protein n=1 Tax=Dreissena polymorpha TaxID=45954 RepID=A0A9D4REC6_DREPO|nr:hypothetical protein DPMN_028405 [Dreissena polymorpha]